MISGVEAFNDYEIGYLSIKTAVDMIKRDINSIEKDIDSEYIDKNSLKNDDKMKFLYPIE